MTLHGTLRYRDLGMGSWVLETDDQRTFDLHLESVSTRLEPLRDQRVEVQGSEGGYGFGMNAGRSVRVRSLRALR